jgi:hypothetical protein
MGLEKMKSVRGTVMPDEDDIPYAKRLQGQIDTWRARAQMAKQMVGSENNRAGELEEEALKRAGQYQKELDRVLGLDDK